MTLVHDCQGRRVCLAANPTVTRRSTPLAEEHCHPRILANKSNGCTTFGDESPIGTIVLAVLPLKLIPNSKLGMADKLIHSGHVSITGRQARFAKVAISAVPIVQRMNFQNAVPVNLPQSR